MGASSCGSYGNLFHLVSRLFCIAVTICYNSGLDFGCEPSTQLGRPKDHLGGRDGRVSLAIFGGLPACRFALDKGLV